MRVNPGHHARAWHFVYQALKKVFEEGRRYYRMMNLSPLDGMSLAELMRSLQEVMETGVGADPHLLDAVHRLEMQVICPAFYECPLETCEGAVYCKLYNLGSSHGAEVQRLNLTRAQHKEAILRLFEASKKCEYLAVPQHG